jgi:hypothetical protein
VHTRPEPDRVRSVALEAAVRSAIGTPLQFLDDGPDLASFVLSELWTFRAEGADGGGAEGSNPKAFCSVMAMATDSFRTARAGLLIHELGGVFTLLRRAQEMQTLAVSFGLIDGAARRWLDGSAVRQHDLRRQIEAANPGLAALLRTSYAMLSDEAHGRAQNLAIYEDVNGQFRWPPDPDAVDPRRIRSIFTTILALLLAHFGVLRWMLRDWHKLSPTLAQLVMTYYDAISAFVVGHQKHGDWRAIAPGHAAEWLGIDAVDRDA